MSTQRLVEAFDLRDISPSAKLLAIYIGDQVSEFHHNAMLSVEDAAEFCGIPESSIAAALVELEYAGLVYDTFVGSDEFGVHFSTVDEFSGGPSLKKPIPKRVRAAVFRRDGAQCVYCSDTTGPFHLDHIMPQSRGGTDVASNLAVACATCNISKRDKTPEEWGGKPGRSFTLERVDLIRAGDV